MRISAYHTDRAQVFEPGKGWSGWMAIEDAQALETQILWGSKRPKIMLRADAQRFGMSLPRPAKTRKSS